MSIFLRLRDLAPVLAAAALAFPALLPAQPMSNSLYISQELTRIGRAACEYAPEGDDAAAFGGPELARKIAGRDDAPGSALCNCVGEEFADGDEDFLDVLLGELQGGGEMGMLEFALLINTAICMDPDRMHDPDADVVDGDLVEEVISEDERAAMAEGFEISEYDVSMCGMLLDDGISAPGFKPGDVLAKLRRTGQTRAALCDCAATWIAAEGKPLQDQIEAAANPMVIYGSTLAGAITLCLE